MINIIKKVKDKAWGQISDNEAVLITLDKDDEKTKKKTKRIAELKSKLKTIQKLIKTETKKNGK